MRKLPFILLSCLLLASMVGCQDKPKNEVIITKMPPKRVVNKDTLRVGDYSQSRDVEWVGATYTVEVNRQADSSLPIVRDDNGQRYFDNTILVRVYRQDGSVFFNRQFTKKDFDAYVDEPYRKNGVLLGIVLDKAEGDFIYMAASVGSPDKSSDEFVPLVVKISRMGSVSISKDTQLDAENTGDFPEKVAIPDDEGV
ncbi:MAG: DUF4738 domain-containing protein [Prevotella sp.]|nr:DUF4738 domain-containing protein [Prevotella sp.]MBQ6208437.1 DUF4738 domain-containing protein [Prevotella sp.]